jgi:NTE family protein
MEVVFLMSPIPKVAIACQGGGSHAAFAAGVLRALLAPQFRDRYQLLALSGTSGGAMCAALVCPVSSAVGRTRLGAA